MTKRRLLIAALACFALGGALLSTVFAGSRASLSPTPVNLAASQWTTATSFKRFSLANDASGALTFVFPNWADGVFGYLYTKTAYDLMPYLMWTATFDIEATSGSPTFVYTPDDCTQNPYADVWLFLEASAHYSSSDEFDRWWYHVANSTGITPLVFGQTALTANLNDLSRWTSVYGKSADYSMQAQAAFESVKAGARVGLTFGGGCFAGHGVGTENGTAMFTLTDMHAE